jgi:hypothetical protein
MKPKTILHWSPYSILISTPKGLLRKRCPFLVSSIFSKGNGHGQQAFVDLVSTDNNGKLIFKIKNKWHSHSNWKII